MKREYLNVTAAIDSAAFQVQGACSNLLSELQLEKQALTQELSEIEAEVVLIHNSGRHFDPKDPDRVRKLATRREQVKGKILKFDTALTTALATLNDIRETARELLEQSRTIVGQLREVDKLVR